MEEAEARIVDRHHPSNPRGTAANRNLYSITSSASASSVGGTSRPSAFAVFRLSTSSNVVDCTTEWLAEREAELLPVPYFHVVFTLPAAIADIAYQNKAVIYNLLFKASAETL